MNGNRRAKVAAGATVIGLAALGGAALGTNHGLVGPVASVGTAGSGRAPIVTSASGSTAAATGVAGAEAEHRPIVTRASTAGGAGATADD